MKNNQKVALWLSAEEADALLNLLLHAGPNVLVTDEVAERLLCRVAEANRSFNRLHESDTLATGASGAWETDKDIKDIAGDIHHAPARRSARLNPAEHGLVATGGF